MNPEQFIDNHETSELFWIHRSWLSVKCSGFMVSGFWLEIFTEVVLQPASLCLRCDHQHHRRVIH